MLEPLTNERWSYESNCYVCESGNQHGLRIPFFHDGEHHQVVADFCLGDTYSGAPTMIHGGISLAVIDEAMAWAVIALAGKWAMTVETTTSFVAPVAVDEPYQVIADVQHVDGDQVHTRAEIRAADGSVCTRSTAIFLAVSDAMVEERTGQEPTHNERSFLRDS